MISLKQIYTAAIFLAATNIGISADTQVADQKITGQTFSLQYHNPQIESPFKVAYCTIATIKSEAVESSLKDVVVEVLPHNEAFARNFNVTFLTDAGIGSGWAMRGGPSRIAVNFRSSEKLLDESTLVSLFGQETFDSFFGSKWTGYTTIDDVGGYCCFSFPANSYSYIKPVFNILSRNLSASDRALFDQLNAKISEYAQK